MFDIILLFLFSIALICYVQSIQFSNRNLPPGPFMWPFGLGIIPSALIRLRKFPTLHNIKNFRPWECFHLWYKDFGELYSVQFGIFYTTSHEIMTELANVDEYSEKWSHELFTHPRTFGKELGLIFCKTPELWTEMRKFTQRTLRDFGFGKRQSMQSAVESEIQELINRVKKISGDENQGILRIRTFFALPIVNVLWYMVAGKRYEHDDPELKDLMEISFKMMKSTTFVEPVQAWFPWLKKWMPWLVKEDVRRKCYDGVHKFSRKLIDERKETGEYLKVPQSYIDVFLKKIEENKEDPSTVYTEEQLQAMLEDLLQTGSVTTNGTLNYGLLYLTINPEIQRKCREEIDGIVVRNLLPTPEDIEKMPYFQAFLLEVHRRANVVPNPIPRVVPKDWNFRGYTIPKGTFIVSNHYSVQMNKEYWVDPEEFRPERFINDKGEFVQDKRVVHFGYGKRNCIGTVLANHVISVFLASLVQNFEFEVVPGEKAPSTEPEIGVSISPMEYSVVFKSR